MTCRDFLLKRPNRDALEREVRFIRQQFLSKGLPRIKDVYIVLNDTSADDRGRHFAYYNERSRSIHFSPSMPSLPRRHRIAMIAHEFGHAADFAYPKELSEFRKGWHERDHDQVERDADLIAEWALGRPIGYTTPCLIQTLDRGIKRPRGLK